MIKLDRQTAIGKRWKFSDHVQNYDVHLIITLFVPYHIPETFNLLSCPHLSSFDNYIYKLSQIFCILLNIVCWELMQFLLNAQLWRDEILLTWFNTDFRYLSLFTFHIFFSRNQHVKAVVKGNLCNKPETKINFLVNKFHNRHNCRRKENSGESGVFILESEISSLRGIFNNH